jgi:glycosyltransferase involved in cell wall biosynthesis
MARPDVTVVIPAFNPDPADLQNAIDHAWSNEQVKAVIVVDDGSDTPLDVSGCTLLRIEHQGVSAARNAGLNVIKSGWVICCDQDDCYAPGAIDALRDAVRNRKQYAYGDTAYPLQGETHRPGAWHPKLNVGQFGTRYGFLWHTGHKLRFDDFPYNDWDMVLQLEAAGCVGVYVPQVTLMHYKRDTGMMSQLTPQQRQQAMERLSTRWGWD